MVYNLVDKALKLSDKGFHNKNIQLVKTILKANRYPKLFIDKYIKKRQYIIHNNNNYILANIRNNNNNARLYSNLKKIKTPFKSEFFDRMKNVFVKYNIMTIPLNRNNLSNVIKKGKDCTKTLDCPSTVYKLNCNRCIAT